MSQLLGPPWRGSSLAQRRHSAVAAELYTLPQVRVMGPYQAHVSLQQEGMLQMGTLQLDRGTCSKYKSGLRDLCSGVFHQASGRRAAASLPVRVFARMSYPDQARPGYSIENAVYQRLEMLHRQQVHGEVTGRSRGWQSQLRRRGWTTQATPRVAFVLLLHRNNMSRVDVSHVNVSQKVKSASAPHFLGLGRPAATWQHIVVSEAANGQRLGSVLEAAPTNFSLCAVLQVTFQVALKLAILQARTGFVHGDLGANNIICGPTTDTSTVDPMQPQPHARLIGECTFIDFESASIVTKSTDGARAASDAASGGVSGDASAGQGNASLVLGRSLDTGTFYFAESTADLTSAARAFDMHYFLDFWLRAEGISRRDKGQPGGASLIEWLARFHELACNVSRSDFDRLPVRVSGVAKHSFLGSALHSCFWPERVADYILQSKELAKCDQQE